jgi:hypothetical protein
LAQLGRFADGAAARLRQDQNRGPAPADLDPVAATRIIVVGGAQAIVRRTTRYVPVRGDYKAGRMRACMRPSSESRDCPAGRAWTRPAGLLRFGNAVYHSTR